jgi:hydroxyquinol 1,2-dioxygenase
MIGSSATDQLLAEVERSFESALDPRLREVLTAAARHLHAFVAEVRPSTEEWLEAIRFLTAVGQKCTETRQEFILLSDVLGVSSLVEIQAFGAADAATENTVLGPFYVPGSPVRQFGDSIVETPDGYQELVVRGRVTDLAGRPIAGATVDVWQAASNGLYAVQESSQHPDNLRGVFLTREDGAFEFTTTRPVTYPIPGDGPVGRLLRASGRHHYRAAHVHHMVSAPGYRKLITHLFDADSDYLDSDAVFGVRDSLIVRFTPEGDSGAVAARFDVALEPAAAP